MTAYYIILFGSFMIIVGKLALGKWFNPLTIYSFGWTFILWLYSLHLVNYHPMLKEAWLLIYTAWIMLYLGAFSVLLVRRIHPHDTPSGTALVDIYPGAKYEKYLRISIYILSGLSFIGILLQWLFLIGQFGSILDVITHGPKIYQMRVKGLLETEIPYLPSLYMIAICFAGFYLAIKRKLSLPVILPIVLAVIQSIGAMGRSGLLIAGALFISAYMIFPKKEVLTRSRRISLRNFLIIIVVLIVLIIVADYVRMARLMELGLKRYLSSNSYNRLANIPYFTPSMYIYMTGNPVVFSEYLKAGGEHVLPGWYSLAPIYHFLAKFGLIKYTSFYQRFYLTPVPLNTGSYLREIHADFGILGIIGFPYFLGALTTYLFTKKSKNLKACVFLAYLMVIVVFSVFYNAMQLGSWLITLIIAFFISKAIEKKITSTSH